MAREGFALDPSELRGYKVKHVILQSAGACYTKAKCARQALPTVFRREGKRMHVKIKIQLANIPVNSAKAPLKPKISWMKETKATLLTENPDG